MRKELSGQKFGKLTVICERGRKRKEITWLCKCECGNEVVVNGYNLRSGHTQSCGCFVKEQISKANTKHGLCYTRIHSIYTNMKTRCYNPNYHLFKCYGGKSITVCDEWLGENGLQNFYNWSLSNGYSDDLSIDRIDNSLGYSPTNCRWVSMKKQQNNRTNNRRLTYNGITHTMAEWSRIFKINYSTLQSRLKTHSFEEVASGYF